MLSSKRRYGRRVRVNSSVSVIPQDQRLWGEEAVLMTVLHPRTAALRRAVKVLSTVSVTKLDLTNSCHSA